MNQLMRDKHIRVSDRDKRVLKTARDEIDESLALGAVARLGAKKLLEENDDGEAVRLDG
ncbi:MAG: hypothetical protein ABEJ89_07865 [Haloarculaceae archaeon]